MSALVELCASVLRGKVDPVPEALRDLPLVAIS